MKLLSVEIQGFRSFSETQAIDFASMAPGLYYVTGRNEVEPELEANGVGKSSLFDAIYWGLFGKTSLGLRAGTLKSWGSKNRCAVISSWETGTGELHVLRIWQPNTLEVVSGEVGDPRPVDQEAVERLIGMTPSAFLFSTYFAQFTPAFIDLSPAEQSAVFTSVLSLEVWTKAANAANHEATLLIKVLETLRLDLAKFSGQAEELLKMDENFEDAESDWTEHQKKLIKKAQADAKTAEDLWVKISHEVLEARSAAITFQELEKKAEAQERVISHHSKACDKAQEELDALKSKDYKKCPTCGAPVSNEHIKKEIAKKKKEYADASVYVDSAIRVHTAMLDQMKPHKGAGTRLQKVEEKLSDAKASAAFLNRELVRYKKEQNPYTQQREEAAAHGEELAVAIEETESDIARATKEAGHAQYWDKGFKEIRLSLIQESLGQLTLEANEVLYQMGLQDWSIEFDIERETKAGTIAKNFTIMVRAPHTEAAVPWEAWSGGERQRLRLACAMGFANLVSSRTGTQSNVEFWDEPTQGLSESGIQDLLGVLAERAARYQRIILLADHRALDFGGFAGTITIVKDQNGSRIL